MTIDSTTIVDKLGWKACFATIKHSTIRKLLTVVFSTYLLVTVIITGLQMVVEYTSATKNIQKELQKIQLIIQKNLSEAVWNNEVEQIHCLLNGITKSSIVIGAEIQISIGSAARYQTGDVASVSPGNTSGAVKNYIQFIPYVFTLQFKAANNQIIELGKVTLYSSNQVVLQKVKLNYMLILLSAVLKTVGLWAFFLWAGHKDLTIPLRRLTAATQKLIETEDFSIETVIEGKQKAKTELDVLIHSFNAMAQELSTSTKELVQAQLRLSGVINAMPSILIGMTQEGVITEWNWQAAAQSHISSEKAIGKLIYELYEPYAKYMSVVKQALQTKTLQKISKMPETINDEPRFFDAIIYPVIAPNYFGAVIRIDDVTTRVKLEEVMAQTEKMTSVGGLAAGVAHEINNPLGAILQGAQNVLRRVDPNVVANQKIAQELGVDLGLLRQYLEKRKAIEFIEGIRQAGERASHIVTNLLQFSRRSTNTKVVVDFVTIVESALQFANDDYDLKQRTDFKNIKITKEFEINLPKIYCCITEIEQVILNLIKNAAQAMRGMQHPGEIIIGLKAGGDIVLLTVEDNGPGMEDKVRKRIFEPFFTTKPVGEGTGLGLSVSYGIIVENHKGTLEVESTPGVGTKFLIGLPTATAVAYVAANDAQKEVIK